MKKPEKHKTKNYETGPNKRIQLETNTELTLLLSLSLCETPEERVQHKKNFDLKQPGPGTEKRGGNRGRWAMGEEEGEAGGGGGGRETEGSKGRRRRRRR